MAYKDFLVRKTMNEQEKRNKKDLLHTRISPVDFERVKTVADLVDSFGGGSIQARNIGLCAGVFKKMLTDAKRPTIMLGLAGPLIAAGLRKVIRDMVHNNMVDVIVSRIARSPWPTTRYKARKTGTLPAFPT